MIGLDPVILPILSTAADITYNRAASRSLTQVIVKPQATIYTYEKTSHRI